jgi:Ca2+-binding EF-hand superfamily protein
MREKKSSGRTPNNRSGSEPKKKYFLVFEGTETEEIYFDAVKEYFPDKLIDFVTLIRNTSERGFSNPAKMLEMILKNIEEHQTGKYSYRSVIDWITEYIKNEELVNLKAEKLDDELENICRKEYGKDIDKSIPKKELQNVIGKLLEKLTEYVKCKFRDINKNMIEDIIKENDITYCPGFDKIAMIVDRDKGSFTVAQYEKLVKSCSNNGIRLCVTNPCFEFWLLLHFDNATFDEDKMLENAKVSNDVTYCHHILRNTFKGYHKNSYDAVSLMPKIKRAIQNEQGYHEDIIGLKTNIGSNVGRLLNELGCK